MLTSVACSCVRNGRKLSFLAAGLATTGGPHLSQLRSPALLSPASWQLPRGPAVRSVSLSAASRGDTDPPGTPDDRQTFGSLSADLSSRKLYKKSSPDSQDLRPAWGEDEQEEDAGRARRRPGRRNTPYWYFLQCKKLIKNNKLQEALELFSRDMLQGERLQPEEYNYTVLIGGCGRAGQLKKAFRLYNDMKKRGLDAVDATYTALFNACAESPSKQAGLQQALKLEQELRRKNIALSTITYHALLKTHAITNHLQACIHTLKEMLQNGHVVTQETFHYLLMGCLKDKNEGFRLALQVWRQMLKSRIQPDSKNYNLLLRTARDCGIGDPALASGILLRPEWDSQKDTQHGTNVKSESRYKDVIDIELLERQLFIQSNPHGDNQTSFSQQECTSMIPVGQIENTPLCVDTVNSTAPNLLDLFEGRSSAGLSISTIDGASDRLALIGGAKGFLEKMAANGLSPDLRTLTLLADTMEPGDQSLQMLLQVATHHCIKLDTAFFNSVIRRDARAGDLEAAKAVLSVMSQCNVSVDVQTFGSLALGCKQQKDGLQLLEDMQEVGLRPNVQVFSALIGQATRRLDYVYLKALLRSMRDLEVWPNEVIIRQLEFAAQYPPNYNQYKSRNNYLVHIDGFRGYYQQWLRAMPAQDTEDEQAKLEIETEAAESKDPCFSSLRYFSIPIYLHYSQENAKGQVIRD
uniref:Pentatricopeptide repeat-containing protein 1, mitochondrial-like n=1 Tax=Echeneis naucrates TaxID=173247 RepID=A0A665TXR5_ECHNA